jgi:glycosyltransferase involved in cell wall biosynthesis
MKFSIIIPTKNEEANIGRCLDSIMAIDCSRENFEVIVVDNGSDDRTVEIAREKGARLSIRPGLTIAALRNKGAEMANGDVLAFLDADCTVSREWLSEASRYLDRKDIACFGSPPTVPDNATWVQRAWFQVRRKDAEAGETAWLESMNMFVRREVFRMVGGFNEDLVTCEDYDFSLRVKRVGRLFSDSGIVAVHHGEAASLGHFFRKELWRGIGNLRGVGSHGSSWREFPSLFLPPFCCFSMVILFTSVLAMFVSENPVNMRVMEVALLAWQIPLVFLVLWKCRRIGGVALRLQLLMLFNLFFLARGVAMLRRV